MERRWKARVSPAGEEFAQEPTCRCGRELDLAGTAGQNDAAAVVRRRALHSRERSREETSRPRRLPKTSQMGLEQLEDEPVAFREVSTALTIEEERLCVPQG